MAGTGATITAGVTGAATTTKQKGQREAGLLFSITYRSYVAQRKVWSEAKLLRSEGAAILHEKLRMSTNLPAIAAAAAMAGETRWVRPRKP